MYTEYISLIVLHTMAGWHKPSMTLMYPWSPPATVIYIYTLKYLTIYCYHINHLHVQLLHAHDHVLCYEHVITYA